MVVERCEKCDTLVILSTAKHCYMCGAAVKGDLIQEPPRRIVPSFADFTAKRSEQEKTRRTFFKSNTAAKNLRKGADASGEKTISCGLMAFEKGRLVDKRKHRYPLTLLINSNAEEVLRKARTKILAHDTTLPDGDYVLLYPDGTEVISVPGSEETFSLNAYQKSLGKEFRRITLSICHNVHYSEYKCQNEEAFAPRLRRRRISELVDLDSGDELPNVLGTPEVKKAKTTKKATPSATVTSSREQRGSEVVPTRSPDKQQLSYESIITVSEESDNDWLEDERSPKKKTVKVSQLAESVNLEDLLVRAKVDHFESTGPVQHVNVNRGKNFLKHAIRAITKTGFKPNCPLSVKFADDDGNSEGAVDSGGLTKEFFRLCLGQCNLRSGIFWGSVENRLLTLNSIAHQQQIYSFVGRIHAMAFIHCGIGGNYFSDFFYDCLAYGISSVQPTKDLLPNCDALTFLNEVESSLDLNIYREKLMSDIGLSLAEQCGFTKPLAQMKLCDFPKYRDTIVRHILLGRQNLEFEAFVSGLKEMNVLGLIQQFPETLRPIFTCKGRIPLTASQVDKLFKREFSEIQNKKEAQMDAVVFFRDILHECEDDAGKAGLSLEEILTFCTALNVIPVVPFQPSPTISFVEKKYPESSTCANKLYLPTVHESYEDFKSAFAFGIKNAISFGKP